MILQNQVFSLPEKQNLLCIRFYKRHFVRCDRFSTNRFGLQHNPNLMAREINQTLISGKLQGIFQ